MNIFGDILVQFVHPWFLLLLPVPILLLIWYYIRREKNEPGVMYSDTSLTRGIPISLRQRALALMPWIRTLALCLGVIALARPQYGTLERTVNSLGLDVVLSLDVSGSMDTRDYQPSRLDAAKKAAIEFVSNRETDRVSVVLFAEYAAMFCPPTLDLPWVQERIAALYSGMMANQRTAVGEGLLLAVKQLDDSPAKSKVVILLTDGENNVNTVQPIQAAEAAEALGVRVYTIGLLARQNRQRGGIFTNPFVQGANPGIDEETLQRIADMTGGQHFRATDEESLEQIYAEIDQLEKSEIEVSEFADYEEKFYLFWLPGLALLGLEVLLRAFWLRRLP